MKAILGHDDIFKTSIQLYVFLEKKKNFWNILQQRIRTYYSPNLIFLKYVWRRKVCPDHPFYFFKQTLNQILMRRLLKKLQHPWHFVALLAFPWQHGSAARTVLSWFHWDRWHQQHFPSSRQCNRYLNAASRNANLSRENEADMLAMSRLHLRLLYPCSHRGLQGASRLL